MIGMLWTILLVLIAGRWIVLWKLDAIDKDMQADRVETHKALKRFNMYIDEID